MESVQNVYMQQVLEDQQRVVQELNRPKRRKMAAPAPAGRGGPGAFGGGEDNGGSRSVEARVTGHWWWRRVVVPPNVYVVHTRAGKPKPLNVGMGLSFRFDPNRDAYLLVPATLQTIIINARCICAERQGILVQAYVQWIVEEIGLAYQKLDFSDSEDPMGLVNVQLREQAEAAIKDKVSTLSIDEVLADKRPIIEELTLRLREVAEGLGLKIVTVQIKEAIVSSTRVWENLQKPFRSEQSKIARLAELANQAVVRDTEEQDLKLAELGKLLVEREIGASAHDKEVEEFDRAQAERERRFRRQQETDQLEFAAQTETEKVRKENGLELTLRELEIARRRGEAQLERVESERALANAQAELELDELRRQVKRAALQAEAENELAKARLELASLERDIHERYTPESLQARLIERLPKVAAALPRSAQSKTIQIGGSGNEPGLQSLLGFVSTLRELLGKDDALANGSPEEPPLPTLDPADLLGD